MGSELSNLDENLDESAFLERTNVQSKDDFVCSGQYNSNIKDFRGLDW